MTDGDSGNYCFAPVEPGDYVVVEVQPLNYLDVEDYDFSTGAFDPDGVDTAVVLADNDIPVTLEPGEEDDDNDFVEDPAVGEISGYVLNDLGGAMSGVDVALFPDFNEDGVQDGSAIAIYTTDFTGYFEFTQIEPFSYVLVETGSEQQPIFQCGLLAPLRQIKHEP